MMGTNFQFDFSVHLLELLVIVGATWKVIRILNRIYDVLKDFPPHRHGKNVEEIFYPANFQPARSERLKR